LDTNTGDLYIGTSHGLSVFSTPYSVPQDELTDLLIYPNPFLPKEHTNLTIDNLADRVSVHIYSSTGYLVRRFDDSDVFGRRVMWNGKNGKGEFVASGIYLIVAQVEDGEHRMAKVALIR
jgi:hypothetical protein